MCWAKTANPDVGSNVVNVGTGVGSFSCTLTNLQPSTTYYVRAYACNSVGVSYGSQATFTTLTEGGGGGGGTSSYTVSVSANPSDGGTVSGGGTYAQGQSCTYTQGQSCTVSATEASGYTFSNWTENGNLVSTSADYTFTVNADRALVANFTYNGGGGGGNAPQGAINGHFTINANGDQVYFSQGNLQYIGSAATPYWKFADHQWDYLGTSQNGDSQTVDRDLFGWGTSGWNNGNMYYQPYDTESFWDYQTGYGYGPTDGTNYTYDLTGTYANADWGVYNAISNGGDTENSGWRTLTQLEWDYVFNHRNTTSGIRYAKATVNGVNGVVLLPNNWTASIYALNNINSNGAGFTSNTITATDWANVLEANGAVFLPAAGKRLGTSVDDVGSDGYYWSSSHFVSYFAQEVYFRSDVLYTNTEYSRYVGFSVRLVRSAE